MCAMENSRSRFIEIERKFLVTSEEWRDLGEGTDYSQGYLASGGATVRVRVSHDAGFLTVKGPRSGISRLEFEYEIPIAEARKMIAELAGDQIVYKTRYRIRLGDVVWEVDEFHGLNAGLVVAEVELESEDQKLELPDWVGEEVTHNPRYGNASLSRHPFCEW